MSIYSKIFGACAVGNGLEAAKLDLERLQLAKQGLLGLLPHGVSEEETPQGKARRKDKNREDAFQTVALHAAILDQAFTRLDEAHTGFNNRMDDLNEQIEDRLEAIDARLNDPNTRLPDAERQALEAERERSSIIQQEILDEQRRIQERVDDLNQRRDNGEDIDPREIDDLIEDIQDTTTRLDHQMAATANFANDRESNQFEASESQSDYRVSIPVL